MTIEATCPDCGGEYDYIGVHWTKTSCEPELTGYQHELITGLLMGDASVIHEDGREPYLLVPMTNRRFLEWVANELSWVAASISVFREPEDSHSKTKNTRTMYSLRGRSFSQMREYRSWYDDQKEYPNDISLSPTSLKMWYCCDGNLNYSKNAYCRISSIKERHNKRNLRRMFNEIEFNPTITEDARIRFSTDETKDVLDWMGDPSPGFEHKWIVDDRFKYDRVKHYNKYER